MSDDPRTRALGLLTAHLDQRRAAGQTHVWLSPEARAVLREIELARRAAARAGPAGSGSVAASPAGRGSEATPSGGRASPPAASPARIEAVAIQPPAPPASVPADFPLSPPAGSDRQRRLDEVKAGVMDCPHFRALIEAGSLRDVMVFAVGNPHSPLMFVGEAPGAEEERQREPFVGPAGQLLNRIIHAMGLERRRVYISNIVKFRPAIAGGSQREKNRKPDSAEMAAGRPHLLREIEIVRPRIIVALGGSAMEGLFGEPCAITRARGTLRDFNGVPVMPTFHPSYLLRNSDPGERRKLWEDMLKVMTFLGLPITEKQRRFFQPGE